MLNDSIGYVDNGLHCDSVPVQEIVAQVGTPVYVYSMRRVLANYRRIVAAFADLETHIHYSAKANGNLSLLRGLIDEGAGIDAVSGGEIYRALAAGASPEKIVFAGVGKSPEELWYAVESGIGWFNVENVTELGYLNQITAKMGRRTSTRVALRLNPDVQADTHQHIATGHGGAKFGLTAEVIAGLLARQADFPHLDFAGIHIHIGSQLGDTSATKQATEKALAVIAPYPGINTMNIGGGFPAIYEQDEDSPTATDFAATLAPLLRDYTVILEPGRSIVADAGMLVSKVLYVKEQSGQTFTIVDAGMTDLLRPALYGAQHGIVPVNQSKAQLSPAQVVGPVCETTDVLGKNILLPKMQAGDLLAILTSGAYGMVMANNYNARPRPAEIVVAEDGRSWRIARPRETWADLVRGEVGLSD
jgi:diaminopimelate decarboxylase